MDVRMPDGTIVSNVPEGITQSELARRYGLSQQIAPKQEEPGFFDSLKRQLGLTARAGIEGVGGTLALPGTLADAATSIIDRTGILPNALPKFNSSSLFPRAADALGLPTPANEWERVGGAGAQAMAGMGALGRGAQAIAPFARPAAQPALEMLSANPSMMAKSAAGSGMGEQIVKENDGGPLAQMGGALVGGVAAPAGLAAIGGIGKTVADVAATAAAGAGNKGAVERISKTVAQNLAKNDREGVIGALQSRSQDIPGYTPTVAESLAEANIGQPGLVGGKTIRFQRDITGAQGAEDVLTGNARTQQLALEKYLADLNAKTAPMREKALAAAGDVETGPIIRNIDKILKTPGVGASDVVQKSLNDVKEKIASLSNGTKVNAEDLYTVRKEVGNTVDRYAKETQNWDKRLTSGLERTVQRSIDDAIERSGGKGWKDYLDAFSSGMKNVEAVQSRLAEAKKIGAAVKSGATADMAKGEIPHFPTLLSRPMMAANWLLNIAGQGAKDPVVRNLAIKMQDPAEYAKLLTVMEQDPFKVRAQQMFRNSLLTDVMNNGR